MPISILTIQDDLPHQWAVAHGPCDLNDADDKLLTSMRDMIRDAYGEDDVVEIVETLIAEADPAVGLTFDLSAIRAAVRQGMPDPSVEGKKPPQLRNYRSEACEMLAKKALSTAFGIDFPASPQAGKTNANMPILGFDHWGIVAISSDVHALVLVQVKGTHSQDCPPDVCEVLCAECARIPRQTDEICRTLTILVKALDGNALQVPVLRMLESLGRGVLPQLIVAPAVVRGGQRISEIGDLGGLVSAVATFAPAIAKGVSISIGVDLTKFGELVMTKARAA